jgi:hypothetical protein
MSDSNYKTVMGSTWMPDTKTGRQNVGHDIKLTLSLKQISRSEFAYTVIVSFLWHMDLAGHERDLAVSVAHFGISFVSQRNLAQLSK